MTASQDRRPTRFRLRLSLVLLLTGAAALTAAYALNPRSVARRHVEAGDRLAREGRTDRALAEWQEAVRLNPDDPDAWRQIGRRHAAAQEWPKAIEAFKRVARANPSQPRIFTRLADCAASSGDTAAARDYVEQALKRNPNDAAALDIAQELWTAKGEEPQRLEYLRRLARLKPDQPRYLLQLAELLIHEMDYQEARRVVDALIRIEPENGRAYALRGLTGLVQAGSPAELAAAETDIRKSLAHEPNDPFTRFQLARIYRRQGKPVEAARELEHAVGLSPNQYNLHYELALTYQALGESEKAARSRARFEMIRNDLDRALLLEKRCVAYPGNFDYHLEYGLLLIKQRDYPKAEIALRKAVDLRPTDRRAASALHRLDHMPRQSQSEH